MNCYLNVSDIHNIDKKILIELDLEEKNINKHTPTPITGYKVELSSNKIWIVPIENIICITNSLKIESEEIFIEIPFLKEKFLKCKALKYINIDRFNSSVSDSEIYEITHNFVEIKFENKSWLFPKSDIYSYKYKI